MNYWLPVLWILHMVRFMTQSDQIAEQWRSWCDSRRRGALTDIEGVVSGVQGPLGACGRANASELNLFVNSQLKLSSFFSTQKKLKPTTPTVGGGGYSYGVILTGVFCFNLNLLFTHAINDADGDSKKPPGTGPKVPEGHGRVKCLISRLSP